MRIKKLLLPIMMIAFVLTSTIAFAASISISASKASGKVNTNERVVYTITSTDGYIQNVNATIYKVENGTETKLYGGTKTEGDKVNKVTLNFDMPKEPYANVRVKVSANNGTPKSYDYTMDTSTTITVTPAKTSGELTKGSTLDIVTTSSTSGIGLKNVTVKMEDITGAVIKNVSWDIEPEYGNHCSKHTGTINVPNGDYGKVKMTVIVKDFGGNTTTKTFEYTIGKSLDITNNLTITADPASGAKIAKGSKVKFVSTSSNTKVGTRKIEVSIYRNDEFVETKTAESKEVLGNNPMGYSITFNTPGSYKCIVKATDVIGGVKSETFYYTIEDDGTPVTPSNYKVTVSFDPATKSNVEAGDYVRIAGKSAVSSDKVISIKYTMYDDENDKITSKTYTGSSANLYVDVLIPDEDTDYVTITATATTEHGATDTQTAKYYLDGTGDDDDDDADGKIYEGVINPDLDDLAIDLWTVKNQRLYELEDEDIEFVAYYYNFEKTSKKNVVIEIEIPDGFKVKSKSTEYGSATVNKDNTLITYKVGTVPSKELREVRFTLIAKDDDLSETAQNIKAIIYSNNDDEEDTSTQRIYIYETGEKGSRRAFVTGYTDGTFRPDRNITRQEVAAMMARAFNYAAKTVSKTFTDVKTTSWSYRYVVGCANNNVIKGYTDGSFRPLNNITRAELYAMTFRSMEIDEEEKPLFVPKAYKKATSWDTAYVAGLERLRMIDDMDDLDKDEKATRAEVVYLISRVQFRNTSSFKVGYYTDVKASYWNAKDIEAASYNYTFKRTSSGKETVTQGTTFLESDSNYIR